MRVAVIGAGMTGLTAGYRVAKAGHEVDVYERWPGLGGQVATLDVGEQQPLERYYHHLFTSDRHITELTDELSLDPIEWLPSSVGVFSNGTTYAFTSPADLLRFKPLSLQSRIRMGAAVLNLQLRRRRVEPFESGTAKDWIERAMGREAWSNVWGPVMRGKFGPKAEEISMAWLWSKLTLRRQIKGAQARQEMLGYPRGGWQPLLDRLAASIESAGSRVLIDRPVASIARLEHGYRLALGAPESFRRGHHPAEFERLPDTKDYDVVIATTPSDIFKAMLDPELSDQLGKEYLARLDSIEYHTAQCLLLELDRSFGDFYWTNIADEEIPFVGLIEHTNFIGPENYGGRHFLYVANYVAPGDPSLELDADALIDHYHKGLKKVNPHFTRDWVRARWLFVEPAAQPIVTVGYQNRIPPLETGAPGLVLANTTQIYPEDRGTNYSVRLGTDAARVAIA